MSDKRSDNQKADLIFDIVPPSEMEEREGHTAESSSGQGQRSIFAKGFILGASFILVLIGAFYYVNITGQTFIFADANYKNQPKVMGDYDYYRSFADRPEQGRRLPLASKKEKNKRVRVDLSEMKLRTFQYSQKVGEFDVVAKGPPTNPTPTGSFEALHKSKNAFSEHSQAWMPWSIHFYGDYLLHEVPYYQNGNRIETKYSGGCLRLRLGDAEKIYHFVDIGTPIIIKK